MRRFLAILAALLAVLAPLANAEPYLRVHEDDDTGRVSLQVASRTFRRGINEPTITLVGAAHVGDPSFYQALQAELDAHDLVLFEGVGPLWACIGGDASAQVKADATRERIRTLAIAIEQRRRAGQETKTLADVLTGAGYEDRLLRVASSDAWGNALRYQLHDDVFDLTSLGADGKPGGQSNNADITFSELPPILDAELESGEGIQAQLAKAGGMVFQLDAIDYDKPNWRNSDTTAEALSYALSGLDPKNARPGDGSPMVGGGGQPLFDLMRGEGFMGKLAGGLLKLLGSNPKSSAFLRIMLIETMAQADDLMGLAGDVEGLEKMMNVLLAQRNEVVLADIRDAIREDSTKQGEEPGSIAVFYGAGHLPEMEASLAEMGFQPVDTDWFDAIEVDPAKAGMSREQLHATRAIIANMLAAQAQMLKQQPEGKD
ncbi:MAG: type II secretion system protein GspG [Phycisphaeraceae bacterium]|nr:MAG: type II secretion system protein GspG [Phycisphaeraceae bacterium]